MWRVSNTYLITVNGKQYEASFRADQGPNALGLLTDITTNVDFRTSQLERAQIDGLTTGTSYLAGRTVVMDLLILSSDPVERGAKLRLIGELASEARLSPATISYREDDGSYRQVVGKLIGYPALTHQDGSPAKKVQLSWLCPDPLILGEALQVGGAINEPFKVVNPGNATSNPTIYVYGGGSSFTLAWGSKTTTVNLSLASDEHLVIDSANKLVLKNGSVPAYAALVGTELPVLPAGSTTEFELLVTSPSGSPRVTVDWRPAWLF